MGIDDRLSITHKRHRSPLRPNVRFLRDPEVSLLDMLRRFPDESYDLVHCRFLILSLSSEQYQELVQECWRICKPGGYVELLEMDMRVYYTRPCTGKVIQLFNSEGRRYISKSITLLILLSSDSCHGEQVIRSTSCQTT